jgi:hypothetical protein
MLASKPVFGKVTVAGALDTVAVTAIPFELIVTRVMHVESVVKPMNVASVSGSMVVEKPGVSVNIAESIVIKPPTAIVACCGPASVPLGIRGPEVICDCAGTLSLPLALLVVVAG